jgi:hypothetical protein
MKYLISFNESKYTNNYRVEKEPNRNSLTWYNGDKRCGLFDFFTNYKRENDTAYIMGYMKDDKSVDGYQFIKLSIDYLLNNGMKAVVSSGNRSPQAAIVWQRLGNEDKYNVETINRDFPGYIPDRHSEKRITLK